jgi:uncharacterized lipoprotein
VTSIRPHARRWSRGLALIGLAALLGGCSWIGGEPTEAERLAERLRTPPDVLSVATAEARDEAMTGTVDRPSTAATGADRPADASQLTVTGSVVALDLGLPRQPAWAVVGRALERSGFSLIDSDESAYTHRIRYDSGVAPAVTPESGGMLDGLAFWRSEPEPGVETYQVQVGARGKGARVQVATEAGDPAPRGAARQVLAVLAEQLKP